MLHMLVIGPLLSIEVEQAHVLPVDGVSVSVLDISDSWHLEWEQSGALDHRSLIFLLRHVNWLSLIAELK